jgi:hypothetical protein
MHTTALRRPRCYHDCLGVVVSLLDVAYRVAESVGTYGSRNVARSTGRVSRARSVGGHARSTSARCANCERDTASACGRIDLIPAFDG